MNYICELLNYSEALSTYLIPPVQIRNFYELAITGVRTCSV